jgi:hypothetical protein
MDWPENGIDGHIDLLLPIKLNNINAFIVNSRTINTTH